VSISQKPIVHLLGKLQQRG